MTNPGRLRFLVHSGFHKTGTSSLQGFLDMHSQALSPFFYGFGRDTAPELDIAAKAYARRPFPWRLLAFRKKLHAQLELLPKDQNVVLSMESLSGLMPGHKTFGGGMARDYSTTAIPMARVLLDEIRQVLGQDTEIIFLLTTREKDDWLRSVHGHLLRSIRMTDDLDAFQAKFADLPSLPDQVNSIARSLKGIRVEQAALEDYTLARTGPARAVLDLMEVPNALRKMLEPTPRANLQAGPHLRVGSVLASYAKH